MPDPSPLTSLGARLSDVNPTALRALAASMVPGYGQAAAAAMEAEEREMRGRADRQAATRAATPPLDADRVLDFLAPHSCENFTTGPGSCWHPSSGRVPFSAEGYNAVCDGCLAWAVTQHRDGRPSWRLNVRDVVGEGLWHTSRLLSNAGSFLEVGAQRVAAVGQRWDRATDEEAPRA